MSNFIEFLKIVVFGVVEGFTEWLPISSTGHLILVENIVHLNVSEEFMNVFRVVIQLGAILRGKNRHRSAPHGIYGLRSSSPAFRLPWSESCLTKCLTSISIIHMW